MSAKWTIKQMKNFYYEHSVHFESRRRIDMAEELREGMTSEREYPYSARSYITTWYSVLASYWEDDEGEDNKLLMDLLQANSDAIADDKNIAYEIIDEMRKFFKETPVPVHPHAKEIEQLRLFHEKQTEMRKQYEKEQYELKHVKKTRKLRKATP